ncbi:hypothetical protein ACMGGR_18280 [Erwinia sp. BNK-24-b]|uniref:hypothetical protein n=1 Tax=unclassified Erwinia TaxID=2622719 RepID=UPI0039BFD380
MSRLLLSLFLYIPFFASASVTLGATSVTSYEKSVYEEGEKLAIENAAPLDKQSFSLTSDNKKLGDFITGQGFSDKDTNICFVSWATQAGKVDLLVPTIGKADWEAEVCNKTIAVGILSKDEEPQIKVGVIYLAQSPNALATESIIFSIDKEKQTLRLDQALTEKIGSQGATSLGSLRRLYQREQQLPENKALSETDKQQPASSNAQSETEKPQPVINSIKPEVVQQPANSAKPEAVKQPVNNAKPEPEAVQQPVTNNAKPEVVVAQPAEHSVQPQTEKQQPSEDGSLLQVENIVKARQLVTDPGCVDYLLTKNDEPGVDLVEIVEKHSDGCPGDPAIEHRLFSVYVDQKTKQMLSDKDTQVDGTFTPLLPAG